MAKARIEIYRDLETRLWYIAVPFAIRLSLSREMREEVNQSYGAKREAQKTVCKVKRMMAEATIEED